MRQKVRIFVEGEADERFVSQLIEHLPGESLEKDAVIRANGWTNLVSSGTEGLYINMMKSTTADGGVNLVVFDADDGSLKRREELLAWRERAGVEFDLFLLPDDSNAGALEDLLVGMINKENKPVMDCWDGYEESLSKVDLPWRQGRPLTVPAKKTRIYAYLEALLDPTKKQKNLIKEVNRDYLNKNHWNLDADVLKPLASFFQKHLKQLDQA